MNMTQGSVQLQTFAIENWESLKTQGFQSGAVARRLTRRGKALICKSSMRLKRRIDLRLSTEI